ncbi:MAG: HAD hydrolase family protein [Selenomonadaceae bacterium]|nr:HAD hydrolase family protein [Selenomonadaceae bacterium]
MISSRNYGMLIHKLKHYGVEYDFIISNDGGMVRDKSGNVLYQANIDSQVLKAISIEPIAGKSFHFEFSAKDTTYICHKSAVSWIICEAKK